MNNNNQPILLGVVNNNIAKIAERLMVTQNDLTLQQLKTWIIFISTLDTENDDGSNVYVFNAIDFAKRLSIDERKARGTIVADLFDELSRKQIKYRGAPDKKSGECNVFTSNLVGAVVYDADSHMIQLDIPRPMRPFLFLLKRGAYTSIDTKHVAALDTVFSVRIYIYLKTMERQGIFEIPLEEFKLNIGATAEWHNSFANLKRKILQPAAAEIRKHTDYKDFFIEDNGGRGKKATHIRYGFTPHIADDAILGSLSPAAANICRRFSEQVQVVFVLATQHGFDPVYIEDKLDDIPDDVIIANFHYVMYEVIAKDKKRGKDKGPDVYGKYFLTAVQQHWAEQNNKFDEMLGREKDRAKNASITEQVEKAQEQDDVVNSALYYDTKANEYLEALRKEPFALNKFLQDNQAGLAGMAGKNGFSNEKALTGKKNYREHKILIRYITAKMTLNEIEIPKQDALF